MEIIEEQIVDRQGVRVRVLEFSDGSRMELLASLEPMEQQRIVERHRHPPAPVLDDISVSESWREKTGFPIGMRDDGGFFDASEVDTFLERITTLARQADQASEPDSDVFPRIAI